MDDIIEKRNLSERGKPCGQTVEIDLQPPAELDQREIDQDQPKPADK
jgi:hypothetical protein